MKYLPNILWDIALAVLFAAGISLHLTGAITALHIIFWLVAVIGLLAHSLPDVKKKVAKDYTHCPLLWRAYDLISDIAFVAASVWLDWGILAAFMLMRISAKQVFYHEQEKRLKEHAA
ncbi:hypothetical protein EH138_20445 [Salmonella enterica subsp. enterica serovar Eastbourne]|uniref:Uncharacterized protein n=1 Tax=Salmonella enterica subsp. enterica serovar Eastbourne TaxID=486993 RepID=A0A702FCJ8_SALET|nr:hypothetical protein [Salmonella enterica subsp. enterica serovar Eastbourne]ECA1898089.1 hypothetical protein [Salmonella enterica subsp. enterica serovar Eastbourne]HAC6674896.1 hypothetical protein [Salmonella enterica subsp. enterica serovar Eastbourne]HAE5115445.1 hypothetical protein [Salmonella enterica subsp. enterica serovar Eastbourne]HAE8026548.1 hypothetical protein [Salmonella enterica subsp. enterica serovar Eastbourne]